MRIDEAPDEPGAADPIDVHALTRYPGIAGELPDFFRAQLVGRLLHGIVRIQSSFQGGECRLGLLSANGCEEIDRNDVRKSLPQPRCLSSKLVNRLALRLAAYGLGQRENLIGDFVIIAVARLVEQTSNLVVRDAIYETCLAQNRVPTSFADLAQKPLKVFLRSLVHRQGVNSVLDRNGAQCLQPPP